MSDKKGFTLIELLVVMMVIGILIAVAIPNYNTMVMQGAAKAAIKNLTDIYNAQQNYYFANSAYCIAGCNNTPNIYATLGLNINDNNFNYACTANGSSYTCTATSGGTTLTLTGPLPASPGSNPIVLEGASNCATSSGFGCNPVCAGPYCP